MNTIIIFLVMFVMMAVENYWRHRDEHSKKVLLRSYVTNLSLFLIATTAMALLSVSSIVSVAAEYSHFGMLRGTGGVFSFVVALVLFDVLLYFWHRVRHHIPFLWRMHQAHHSELVMNSTTAFRLHPTEVFLTIAVKSVFVIVIGVNEGFALVNEIIMAAWSMFHHANVSFAGERQVSRFVITPFTHRAHHSTKGTEFHRNFGVIFPFWDKLFGTFIEMEPLTVGLGSIGEQNFWNVLFLRRRVPKIFWKFGRQKG